MTRPLDPAERYFLALGRMWPRQITGVAELDPAAEALPAAVPGAAACSAAWSAVAARRAVAQLRVVDADTRAPHFVRRPGSTCTVHDGMDLFDAEQRLPFDLDGGPLVRLGLCAGDPTRVALSAHHSVADARTVVLLLQEVCAELAGRGAADAAADVAHATAELPPAMYDRLADGHRWTEDREGMIELLHVLRDEQAGVAPPSAWPSHERTADGADLVTTAFGVDVGPLVEAARAWDASVHGVLSAAVVAAAHEAEPAVEQVALLAPVDMRAGLVDVDPREHGLYISMLTTTHSVSGEPAGNARQATSELRRRVARGDGELTFLLTRPAAVEREIAAAPQSIVVSNLGVIDDDGDPSWLRSVSFTLGPSPNQVAFVGFTTYRGRLNVALCVDRARLDAGVGERFAQALQSALVRPLDISGALAR